jgi:hypothetical protein
VIFNISDLLCTLLYGVYLFDKRMEERRQRGREEARTRKERNEVKKVEQDGIDVVLF